MAFEQPQNAHRGANTNETRTTKHPKRRRGRKEEGKKGVKHEVNKRMNVITWPSSTDRRLSMEKRVEYVIVLLA